MNPVKATTCLLFVAALLAGTLQAQPIDREMYAKVAGMNNKRNCPRHELTWTVNKLSYKSGYLHFDLTLRKLFAEGRDSADLRRYFADRLRYRLEPVEFNYLYEKLGDIKGGFVYDITIDSSDARLTLRYSPSEARQIWADRTKPDYKNSKKWQGRENIRYINNSNNRNMPNRIDEHTRIDTVYLAGDTLFYLYTFFEDKNYKREHVEMVLPTFKLQYKSFFQTNLDLFEIYVDADIHLLFRFRDTLRNEIAHLFVPHAELEDWMKTSNNIKPATDAQIDAFIQEQIVHQEFMLAQKKDELSPDPDIRLTDVEYADQVLQYTYTLAPELYGEGSSAENEELIRRSTAVNLRRAYERFIGSSAVYDGGILTLERFYQRLKGVRLLYMEADTRRTIDIFIPSDEIRNSPKMEESTYVGVTARIQRQMIKEQLLREMEGFNRDSLPIELDFGTLDSVAFRNSVLHYHYSVAPDMAELFLSSVGEKDYRDLLDIDTTTLATLAELDAGITLHWRFPDGQIRTLAYSTSDIDSALAVPSEVIRAELRRTILEDVLPAFNRECPTRTDEFTVLDSIGVENGMIIYYYTLADGFPLDMVNNEEIRWQLESSFVAGGEDIRGMIDLFTSAGYGLCYRYRVPQKPKKSTKSVSSASKRFCFTAEELREFLYEE